MLFWVLSFGIFLWMRESLVEGYISRVKQIHEIEPHEIFDLGDEKIATIAGTVVIAQLGLILFTINGGFFVLIPLVSYYLTGKTLHPIQKLYEQQKQFVSDASHELRTPLSIMSGEMELALKKQRSGKEYKKIIQSSFEEINRLSTLVNNLLFLARGTYGKQKIKLDRVDITDLINTVVHIYHLKIREKTIKIHFTPAEKSLMVCGQHTMLQTLFSNLVDNAIKYTPDKGQIWIRITSDSEMVHVDIKDNGIGLNRIDQEKIFDRFFRADASRSETKGFGLGLSIAQSIAHLHNGNITVDSVANKGSVFTVSLPQI
jgi:two-component system, OmpR family, sensor kinase